MGKRTCRVCKEEIHTYCYITYDGYMCKDCFNDQMKEEIEHMRKQNEV